jgi:hypothetical protein
MEDFFKKMAINGAKAAGGVVVEGISDMLKGEMTERSYDKDKMDALDTVTGVCMEIVPDVAGKAVDKIVYPDKERDKELTE